MTKSNKKTGLVEKFVQLVFFIIFLMFPIMVGIHWYQFGIESISSISMDYSYTVFNLVLPLLAIMAYFKKDLLIDILKDVVGIFKKVYASDAPRAISTDLEGETLYKSDKKAEQFGKDEIDIEKNNQNQSQLIGAKVKGSFGPLSFDYSQQNGIFPVKYKNMEFTTKWSRANIDCIHVYHHNFNQMESVARARDKFTGYVFKNFEEIIDPGSEIFDTSSDVYTANLDEIVIWKNKKGNFLLTKINYIEYEGRNSKFNKVNFTCQFRE